MYVSRVCECKGVWCVWCMYMGILLGGGGRHVCIGVCHPMLSSMLHLDLSPN